MKLTLILLSISAVAPFAIAAPTSSVPLPTTYHAKPRKVKKHKGVRHHV